MLENEIKKIPKKVTQLNPYIAGDKGYDSKKNREIIKNKGMKDLIPTRKTNKNQRNLSKREKKKYKERNKENYFGDLKRNAKLLYVFEKTSKSLM